MRLHITSLQEQVDTLFANLSSLLPQQNASNPSHEAMYSTTDGQPVDNEQVPPPSSSTEHHRQSFPRFHGPTSSAYGFDVANSTLKSMGLTKELTNVDSAVPGDRTATASPQGTVSTHPSKDPLWAINQEEAIRLCRIYEEEMGIMYPLFDIEIIVERVKMLWSFLEAALRSGLGHFPGADAIVDDDTNLIKMVLAAALTVESNGHSDLGQILFEAVKPAVTASFWGPIDMKGLSLICVAVGCPSTMLVDCHVLGGKLI